MDWVKSVPFGNVHVLICVGLTLSTCFCLDLEGHVCGASIFLPIDPGPPAIMLDVTSLLMRAVSVALCSDPNDSTKESHKLLHLQMCLCVCECVVVMCACFVCVFVCLCMCLLLLFLSCAFISL